MRERVLRNWTLRRGLYASIGAAFMVQSWLDGQWSWFIYGLAICSMGVFALGCAGGACSTAQCAQSGSHQVAHENVDY